MAGAPDRPFRLAELIDLELQLAQDRDASIEQLEARDEPIARRLAQSNLRGRAALRAWLEDVRGAGASIGERIAELRDLAARGLFACGLLAGIASVGGWLLSGTGSPINVIHFWPAVIGLQLALLAPWLLAALPQRWLGRALPWLIGRSLVAALRLDSAAVSRALAELRRLDWLYSRLRLWLVTALTQSFALGFNLGALGAFVAIPYVDDPAFGWRSRLLDAPEVAALAESIALPWRGWLPRAVPAHDDVAATRYSSIDRSLARDDRPGPAGVWAVWWSFLVASLVSYGLLPRLLLWTVSQIGVRWELRNAPRAHTDLEHLQQRLAGPLLDTRANRPESALPPTDARPAAWSPLPPGPVHVLCWSGVPLDDAQIRSELARARVEVAGAIARVGLLDQAQDRRALAALGGLPNGAAACLVVPAWEPPVGEHLDFVRELRGALGSGRTLCVLLHPLAGPATADDAEHWRSRLQALGDPWLCLARWPAASA